MQITPPDSSLMHRFIVYTTLFFCFIVIQTAWGQELETDPALQHQAGQRNPFVLKGGITTLEGAIQQEGATIDWYNWYLSCREYLRVTGGLNCPLGTVIRFYKNGRIEALTADPYCRMSVANRRFPLPVGTQLEAVGFPVRAGQAPPASRQEVYERTQGQ